MFANCTLQTYFLFLLQLFNLFNAQAGSLAN